MKKVISFVKLVYVETIVIILLLVSLVINLHLSCLFRKINLGSLDIIVEVLPLVITVLSIVLSLPKDIIYGLEKSEFTKFNEIPNMKKIWFPRDLFIRNGAIKVNFELVEKDSSVTYLTKEEINTIIDKDYKLVNGLYGFKEYSNSDIILYISREKLYEMLSKKYFTVRIAFKFGYVFDWKNIFSFLRKKSNKYIID